MRFTPSGRRAPRSSPLGPPSAQIASVSRTGELAILLERRPTSMLARMLLAGGAPRDILEDVTLADWSRRARARCGPPGRRANPDRVPIGKSLYESTGYVQAMRVSPSGIPGGLERSSAIGDSLGSLVVVDRAGQSQHLSAGGRTSEPRLATGRQGELVTGSPRRLATQPWGGAFSGRERLIEATPGRSRSKTFLARERAPHPVLESALDHRSGPGRKGGAEILVARLLRPIELSADGKTLLFEEWGEGGGPHGSIYLRRFDESTPVRLGNGLGLSLSPDGKTVLARLYTSPPKLALIPAVPARRAPRGRRAALRRVRTLCPTEGGSSSRLGLPGRAFACTSRRFRMESRSRSPPKECRRRPINAPPCRPMASSSRPSTPKADAPVPDPGRRAAPGAGSSRRERGPCAGARMAGSCMSRRSRRCTAWTRSAEPRALESVRAPRSCGREGGQLVHRAFSRCAVVFLQLPDRSLRVVSGEWVALSRSSHSGKQSARPRVHSRAIANFETPGGPTRCELSFSRESVIARAQGFTAPRGHGSDSTSEWRPRLTRADMRASCLLR